MAHNSVSQDEGSEEPVYPVNKEVVIHVVPYVLQCQLTVVVIGVHLLGYWLV